MTSKSARTKSNYSFNPERRRFIKVLGSSSFALFLYGCGVVPQSLTHTPTAFIPSATPSPTATPEPTSTRTPEATSTPSPTPRIYDTTEYEGTYSEKYYPDLFTDTIMLGNAENGLQIPLYVGLTSDMPVKGFGLTERGNEFFTDVFIAACWWKYSKVEGHEISKEDFVTKMKNGEIEMETYYLDELTGEKKTGRYNPLNGLSLTGTFVGEMPLLQTPKTTSTKSYYYLSSNRNGLPILAKDMGEKFYKIDYQDRVLKQGINEDYFKSDYVYGMILSMITIFNSLERENFYNYDGMVKNPYNSEVASVIDRYTIEDIDILKAKKKSPYIDIY